MICGRITVEIPAGIHNHCQSPPLQKVTFFWDNLYMNCWSKMNVWITSLQPSQMILLLGWKLLLQESILFCLFIGQWPDSADKRMTGTKLCAGQLQSIRKWRRNPYFSQPSHFFSPLASGSKLGSTCRQSSFLSSSSSVDWIFGIAVHFLPIFLYSLTLHPAWSS